MEQLQETILDTPEHRVASGIFSARKHDPASGITSVLVDMSTGDWSWKPLRDKKLGENFRTFLGVPPSTAELSHT